MSTYLAARRLQRPLQVVMSGIVVSYGMAAIAILTGPDQRTHSLTGGITVAIGVYAVVAAALWLYRWPSRVLSVSFVLTSAVALTVPCLVHPGAVLVMLGASGFGVLAGYVAFFHSAKVMTVVVVGALLTTSTTQARMAVDGGAEMVLGTLPAVVVAMVSFPFAIQVLVRQLGEDAQHSTIDPLTGLLNRRGFHLAAQELVTDMARDRREMWLTVALIDLDRFKMVNDTHGHETGDRLLVAVGQALQEASAHGATARIGGEEFLVAEVVPDEGRDVGERLLEAVSGVGPDITASIGVDMCTSVPEDPVAIRMLLERLIASADAAMYEAKRAGGNSSRYGRAA